MGSTFLPFLTLSCHIGCFAGIYQRIHLNFLFISEICSRGICRSFAMEVFILCLCKTKINPQTFIFLYLFSIEMFITSLLSEENPICLEHTVVSSVSCEKLLFSVGCASKILALKGRFNKSHTICLILSALSNHIARVSPNTNKHHILKPEYL